MLGCISFVYWAGWPIGRVGFQQNEGNSLSGCLAIFFFSLLICLCPIFTLWFVGINSDFVGLLGVWPWICVGVKHGFNTLIK
jgi:hypothetical protein